MGKGDYPKAYFKAGSERLIAEADARYQLTQRERITLAALALSDGLTARELVQKLELSATDQTRLWLGRLLDCDVVRTTGKTSTLRYFVAPDWLRNVQLDKKTTLSRIPPHRLHALILEDLTHYPDSSSTEINRRIGAEISAKTVKRALDYLFENGKVTFSGEKRWRKYSLAKKDV